MSSQTRSRIGLASLQSHSQHPTALVRLTLNAFILVGSNTWFWVCLWLFGLSISSHGQDPFSESTAEPVAENPLLDTTEEPAATPMATSSEAGAAASDTQNDAGLLEPLVRALREHPPQNPGEMARAMQWMAKLKHWNEVGRLLQQVQQFRWSDDQLAVLSRAGGAALWVRLGGREELTAEQRTFVATIHGAPSRLARDPTRMNEWIDQLSSSSASHRRYAQMRLHDAGKPAIERMLARLLEGVQGGASVQLLGTIVQFGEDGLDAIRAANFVSDHNQVARLLESMAAWRTNEFSPELAAALFSIRFSETQRAGMSAKVLKQRGRLPEENDVRRYLAERFAQQLAEYQRVRIEKRGLTDFVWRPTADGTRVENVPVALEQRALERLAQLAAHRLTCSSATQQDLVESVVVLLQRAYKVAPGIMPAVAAVGHADSANAISGLLISLPTDVRRDFGLWQKVIAVSQKWQMHGAAIRAIEIIGRGIQLESGQIATGLETLAESLKDPRPVVRYVAFEAIANLDPQTAYWGADRQLRLAIEMSRLESGPNVLVLGLREAFRSAAVQQLETQGAKVLTTNSLSEALRLLDQPHPVEMMFIVDRLAEHTLSAAIERLRNSRRGAALPLVIMTSDLDDIDRAKIADTPGTITSVLSRDPNNMARVLASLQEQLDTRALTTDERVRLANSANQFITRIAADTQRYSFYPLREAEAELGRSNVAMPVELKQNLLAAVGSSDNQEKLMRMAADRSLGGEHRMGAAQAFKRSVRQFGVRMRRTAVGDTYDLYNRQGPTDEVTVSAIGLILDSLEAGAGYKQWSDVK